MPQGKPKPLVRAPEGSTTTDHHIVVLKEDTSKSDLHNVMERVNRMSEDVVVHRYTEHAIYCYEQGSKDTAIDQATHSTVCIDVNAFPKFCSFIAECNYDDVI